MADRDWDKELAKVDKQLASLSDEALLGNTTPAPVAKGGREVARAPSRPAPIESAPAATKGTSAFGVYARLALAVTVAGAMMIWPYPAKCGLGLAGYLAAVGVVVAGGLWSSVWTWRHLSAPPAMPTVVHPRKRAIWPATLPTAPDAADTATVCPASVGPIRCKPTHAVTPGIPRTPRYAGSGACGASIRRRRGAGSAA